MSIEIHTRYIHERCIPIPVAYVDGGLGLRLIGEDGEPVATLTVRVPGLDENEVAIKNYSENEGLLDVAIDAGWVDPPHRTVAVGYVDVPVCKIKAWPDGF